MEPYKTFLVPLDYTKLNLFMRYNSVKNRKKNISSDDEEAPHNSESLSDKEKRSKGESCGTNFGKTTLPKEYTKTQKLTNGTNLISP